MAIMSRDFGTMLDELIAEAEVDRAQAANIGAIDFLTAMEELQAGGLRVGDPLAAAQYREVAADAPVTASAAPRQQAGPIVLPSLDPSDIRRELGIDAARNSNALDAARRRFAFANHPDRVEPRLRERAEQRMQIANMLVDQAKRDAR